MYPLSCPPVAERRADDLTFALPFPLRVASLSLLQQLSTAFHGMTIPRILDLIRLVNAEMQVNIKVSQGLKAEICQRSVQVDLDRRGKGKYGIEETDRRGFRAASSSPSLWGHSGRPAAGDGRKVCEGKASLSSSPLSSVHPSSLRPKPSP